MPKGRLSRRQTELTILRVAEMSGCIYEQHHHAHLAKRAGFSDEEIERVAKGSADPNWNPRDRDLLIAVEQLFANEALGELEWDLLRRLLSDRQIIELVMLVGHYRMLATTIKVLDIQPDK